MNKIIKILKLTNLYRDEFNDFLLDSIIEKNTFEESTKTFFINLKLNKIVPFKYLETLKSFTWENNKVNINFIYKNEPNKEDISSYITNLVKDSTNNHFAKKIFSDSRFEYLNKNIYFKTRSENEKSELLFLEEEIKSIFEKYFSSSLNTFIFEDDKEFINKCIEMKKEEKKRLTNAEEALVKRVHNEQNFEEKKIKEKAKKISNLSLSDVNVTIIGEIYEIVKKEIANKGLTIYSIYINDHTSTFILKYFHAENPKFIPKFNTRVIPTLKIGDWVKTTIKVETDNYEKEPYGSIKNLIRINTPEEFIRIDTAEKKRIELCSHTKMSSFDGIIDVNELIDTVEKYEQPAIGITDRNNIQSYPLVQKYIANKNIKPIYGVEVEIVDDDVPIVINSHNQKIIDSVYIIFDLETTGLFPEFDDIIEFAASKYHMGKEIDKIQFFIKPKNKLSEFTKKLTNISDDDVNNAINPKDALFKIASWIEDSILIAHNGIDFDMRFLQKKAEQYNFPKFKNTVIDSMKLARAIHPDFLSHSLGRLAKKLKVEYDSSIAHRADYDVKVLSSVWTLLSNSLINQNILYLDEIDQKLDKKTLLKRNFNDFNYIYVKNEESLKELYELISISYTSGFLSKPTLKREQIDKFKNNLIVTNSPIDGRLINIALSESDANLKKEIEKYDYIFISPISAYSHWLSSNIITEENLKSTIIKIINFAISKNKKVIAVSDNYYLNPSDKKYRDVYIYAKTLGGKRHRYYYNYKTSGDSYLRTTDEMINEFNFLNDEKLINEIVVENTHIFANSISDNIKPIKNKLYVPELDNVNELLKTEVWKNIEIKYGSNPDKIIIERLEKELNAIINNGYAVIYWISHLLIKQSIQDEYVVGSRGSVGSSLVATMLNITDVNPLSPHYVCSNCKKTEFIDYKDDGFDLETKKCSECNFNMHGEGHNIPFETFLGFKFDKIPDIDLNFSGEYQNKAHDFLKKQFGEKNTFRAGTISTIADKTSYGYVKAYFEEKYPDIEFKNSESILYKNKCRNVKRTTGQHPGGILVVPTKNSIFEFTPYNYPADDVNQSWFTTHFAFEHIHDNLLKFDILGHDNPTILKKLKDLTKIDSRTIPYDDKKVLEVFKSLESLNVDKNAIPDVEIGTLTIPEFGTSFVREMLKDTQPESFSDLIRISCLSHGTNVYLNNAKDLISKNNFKLSNVIAGRDDILLYLLKMEVEPSFAFKIMEDVRKGKGLTDDYMSIMRKHNVPEWYIDSCKKIKYMFPKAHATAYVMHAWQFAWFKIYYPLEYYATFLSVKSDVFDIQTIAMGKNAILEKLYKIKNMLKDSTKKYEVTKKEQDLLVLFQITLEMIDRGINILPPDLKLSHATDYIIHNKQIIAPFNSIDGLGEAVAKSIQENRDIQEFKSFKDLKRRTKLNQTSIEIMAELNMFKNLDNEDQIKLF